MSQQDTQAIVCSDGCKRNVPDEKGASNAGWEFLPIARRWRCVTCWRELRAVNQSKTDNNEQLP